MFKAPSDLPNDIEALKALVLAQQAELQTHTLLIQALRLQIARLRKQKHGRSSEKIQREIEQLEMALEGLEIASAENKHAPSDEGDKLDAQPIALQEVDDAQKPPRRRPRVCESTPRERTELNPGDLCPDYRFMRSGLIAANLSGRRRLMAPFRSQRPRWPTCLRGSIGGTRN